MAWLESHQSLQRHPKTYRLCRALDVTVPAAIGHLQCLWWWCMDYAPDGDLTEFDHDDIARASMWDGDADVFFDALLRCGFIDQQESSVCVHDWDQYGGKLNETKERNRDRQRRFRERHREEAVPYNSDNGHVTDTSPLDNALEKRTVEDSREEKKSGGRRGGGTANPATAEDPISSSSSSPPRSDVEAQARALIGDAVFADLTKHLLVAGSESDVETVAEAIITYPLLPHMLEARRCRSRYGSWHSKTSAQRASLFTSWLVTAEAIRLERAEKFGVKDRPNVDASVEPILPANVGPDVARAFEIVSEQLPPEEYNRYMGRITTSQPNGNTIWVSCADPRIRERMKSRYLPLLTLAFHEIHSPLRPQLAPDAA